MKMRNVIQLMNGKKASERTEEVNAVVYPYFILLVIAFFVWATFFEIDIRVKVTVKQSVKVACKRFKT